MAKHRAVAVEIWDDMWFSQQDTVTRLFWLFLLTNSRTTSSGIYRINEAAIAALMGVPVAEIVRCKQIVTEAGRCLFDQEWVIISRWLVYQPAPNASMWVSVLRQVGEAPKALRTAWIEQNRDRVPPGWEDTVASLSGDTVNVIGYVPRSLSTVQKSNVQNNGQDDEQISGTLGVPVPYAEIVKRWNDFAQAHGLKPIRKLTAQRKQKVKSRWAEWGQDGTPAAEYLAILARIAATPFLMGQGNNDRGWLANFDWLFRSEATSLRIQEGAYEDQEPGKNHQKGGPMF